MRTLYPVSDLGPSCHRQQCPAMGRASAPSQAEVVQPPGRNIEGIQILNLKGPV